MCLARVCAGQRSKPEPRTVFIKLTSRGAAINFAFIDTTEGILMPNKTSPAAIVALDVSPRTKPSNYPEPFASRMVGREKRQLGDFFGLSNFGVNLTRLIPGSGSALRHSHSKQDEFIYIVEGSPTLITNQGETELVPGMCAGFKAGTGNANHLVNRTDKDVLYLEIGDRTAGDAAAYPDDDLEAVMSSDGKWMFAHKNGIPY